MAKAAQTKAAEKAPAAPPAAEPESHVEEATHEDAVVLEKPSKSAKPAESLQAALTGKAAKESVKAPAAAAKSEEAEEETAAEKQHVPDTKAGDIVPAQEAPPAAQQVEEQNEKAAEAAEEAEVVAEAEPEPEPAKVVALPDVVEKIPDQVARAVLYTAPIDPRFASVFNQSKYCWTMYNEYLRCVKAKGDAKDELCLDIRGDGMSMCPNDWVTLCSHAYGFALHF